MCVLNACGQLYAYMFELNINMYGFKMQILIEKNIYIINNIVMFVYL